jgi:hypothetical protein
MSIIMKKIILILFLLSAFGGLKSANAQVIYEHTYDSAAYNLYMVHLEVEGMKYVFRNYTDRLIMLYNLNHSLFKTMPLPVIPLNGSGNYILYISEHLFNTDDSIEYMYGYKIQNGPDADYRIYILSESGNIVFYADSLIPVVQANAPQEQLPIYDTPNGAKLILTDYFGNAQVYGLGGHLSNAIQPLGVSGTMDMLSIFPNPSHENTTIDFTLPKGINTADIVLYNLNGTEIKRYKVDNTFNNLVLNNSDLKSGTYLYELVTANGSFGAKRMVVIR